ncbi:MAG: cell wall hydrolase [Clostridia bacterium]|nr:cell wall hydrolase [Clostridia bacterium]
MPYTDRELFARLIACEAGGEGDDGMKAVATTVMNRVRIPYGEFARVSQGGNLRNIIFQPNQYTCMKESIGGQYNSQNIYNIDPGEVHYDIADWAIAGNILKGVDHSIFYFNPYSPVCIENFPPSGTGKFHNRVHQHCFYVPTMAYRNT